MHLRLFTTVLALFCFHLSSHSQVVIGTPAGSPDATAVLELRDTTRGLLLPRLSQTNMNAISNPADGLLVYNISASSVYQYHAVSSQWKPIVADSSEWYFDPLSAKLYLRRALNNTDSFYYNTGSRKFMFADTRMYRTSTGGVFNLDEGNSDRFIFKTTASRFPRPVTNINSANLYSVYEVDNDTIAVNLPFESAYYGIASDATVLPSATQRVGIAGAYRGFTTFAGTDTISLMQGLLNQVTLRGKGHSDLIQGISNNVSVRDSVITIGQIVGIQNNISYISPLGTPRIQGNVYGYFNNWSPALNGKVDGNAYGIFLGNINATGVGSVRNWGIYTNKGAIRFGDSLLVTDGSAFRPRAVLDVNATSAMIIPSGNTAQRPVTLYTGMIRHNLDNAAPEAYNGTAWISLKNPVLSSSGLIDPPLIPDNNTSTVIYPFTGVVAGNTVTISPASPLPSGIVIAWATVTAPNQVTIGFANFSGAPVDLPAQTFYIKVIQ